MQWEILREPLRSQYRPTPAILDECRAAGKMLAECAAASKYCQLSVVSGQLSVVSWQ